MTDLIIKNRLSILAWTFLAIEFGFRRRMEVLEESKSFEVFKEVIDRSVSDISEPTSEGEARLFVFTFALESSNF